MQKLFLQLTFLTVSVCKLITITSVTGQSIVSDPIISQTSVLNKKIWPFSKLVCIAKGRFDNIDYNFGVDSFGVFWFTNTWEAFTYNLKINNVLYMTISNNQFYLSIYNGSYDLIVTSFNSTRILSSVGSGARNYLGLTNDLDGNIIAASYELSSVDIFDKSLNPLSSVPLKEKPFSVAFYDSKIYVGYPESGKISIISNNNVIATYQTQCPFVALSLTIDSYGYIAQGCLSRSKVFFYDSNVVFKDISISVSDIVNTGLDTDNELVVLTKNSFTVYSKIGSTASTTSLTTTTTTETTATTTTYTTSTTRLASKNSATTVSKMTAILNLFYLSLISISLFTINFS